MRSRLFHRHQMPLVVVELFRRAELHQSRTAAVVESEMYVTVDKLDREVVVISPRIVE